MNHLALDSSIIIGVDPGTQVSGYGIIQSQQGILKPLDYGCIRPPLSYKLSDRYLVIHDGIEKLIDTYKPTALVVETQYLPATGQNVQGILKLGMARGIIMIAAKKKGIAVFQYEPAVAKKAVAGNGRASKYQVQKMVQMRLSLSELPEPADAADALALAICHLQRSLHTEKNHEI